MFQFATPTLNLSRLSGLLSHLEAHLWQAEQVAPAAEATRSLRCQSMREIWTGFPLVVKDIVIAASLYPRCRHLRSVLQKRWHCPSSEMSYLKQQHSLMVLGFQSRVRG